MQKETSELVSKFSRRPLNVKCAMHVVEFVPSASVIVIGGERYVIFSLQHPLTRLDALIISTSPRQP